MVWEMIYADRAEQFTQQHSTAEPEPTSAVVEIARSSRHVDEPAVLVLEQARTPLSQDIQVRIAVAIEVASNAAWDHSGGPHPDLEFGQGLPQTQLCCSTRIASPGPRAPVARLIARAGL